MSLSKKASSQLLDTGEIDGVNSSLFAGLSFGVGDELTKVGGFDAGIPRAGKKYGW